MTRRTALRGTAVIAIGAALLAVATLVLVGIVWAVFKESTAVKFGVLLASLGATMAVTGASAALSSEGKTIAGRRPG